MKLGICAPVDRLTEAHALGYDYIEMNLSALAAAPEQDFAWVVAQSREVGMPVEALNVFVPGSIPLVGPSVDIQAIESYLVEAFSRASTLGARVIVFGSGGARRVPEGFDHDEALSQIADFLRLCDRLLTPYNLRIAIEPLCSRECNILNTVREATALAKSLGLPKVGVLGDTYHMHEEGEPLSALAEAGPLLWHVHVANPVGRLYPRPGDGGDYAAVFEALQQGGYDGRISVEVGPDDFSPGARLALDVLRPYVR